METQNKTVGKTTTECVGVTETQNKERVFREKNILGLFQELNDTDQANFYSLIWSMTAKDMLYKFEKSNLLSCRKNLAEKEASN